MAAGGRAPHAHEQPGSRGGRAPRGPRRLRRHGAGGALLGGLRRDRPHAPGTRRRGDAPRAVRQAGGRVPDARPGAARPDLELDARAEVGRLGHVPRARGRGPDDVRADDGGFVDLHRDTGDPAGDVRDVRRGGVAAVRRLARRNRDAHRRARRHGRGAAARGHDERRRGAVRRGGPGADRATGEDAIPRSRDGRRRPGARLGRGGEAGARGGLDRPGRQLRRGAARPAAAWVPTRPRDRPDERPRPARRLRAFRAVARGRHGDARHRPGAVPAPRLRVDGRPRRGDGRVPRGRRRRVRLRQQPAGRRGAGRPRPRARVRVPGVRAGVHPSDVLRGQGPVPMGGPVGRPRGHHEDRPRRGVALPRERTAATLARDGRGPRRVPGAARRGSAGSGTANVRRRACASTRWWRAASSRPPS